MPLLKKDLSTDTWSRVREHLQGRVDALLVQLECDSDHDTTTAIRGRLREARDLLRLETAPANVPRPGDRLALDPEDPSQGGFN